MGFEQISKNTRVREYLQGAFSSGSVPHAFLISGTVDEDKKKIAAILARALVCTGENVPCDNCPACKKAQNGLHPDIITLNLGAASIKVDDIRQIRQDAFVLPNDGERKVYIINNADKMTQEAQDALLKILEEPPRFTTFVLLCYNHSSLLPTVLSRVTHLKLQSGEDARYDETDIEIKDAANAVAKAVASRDELLIVRAFIACEKMKRDQADALFTYLTALLRDALMCTAGVGGYLTDDAVLEEIAAKLNINEILKITELVEQSRRMALKNVGVAHISAYAAAKIYDVLK